VKIGYFYWFFVDRCTITRKLINVFLLSLHRCSLQIFVAFEFKDFQVWIRLVDRSFHF